MEREHFYGANGDGTINFLPEYTKTEVGYRTPGTDRFDQDHDRCEDCVHFIEGGGCHLVQGRVSPNAYCEQHYGDYMVAAHDHGAPEGIEVNYEEYGPAFGFSIADAAQFATQIRERIEQRVREGWP